jgi:hypothetical protein
MREQYHQQYTPYSRQQQDEDLDIIYHGAKRLNQHARAINGEVIEQNHLIDDLSDDIDAGQRDLEAGVAKAEMVNKRKKKVCCI